MAKSGRPPRKTDMDSKLALRLSSALKADLQKLADADQRSLSLFAMRVLQHHVDENKGRRGRK